MSLTNQLADLSAEYLSVVDAIEACEANAAEHADAIEVLESRRDDLLQTIAKRLTNAAASEGHVLIGGSLLLEFVVDRNQPLGLHVNVHVDASDTGLKMFDHVGESD